MSKIRLILLITLLLCTCCFFTSVAAGEAETSQSEESEWTVMIYMCGSDLESRYSYATGNLEEINRCKRPFSEPFLIEAVYGDEVTEDMLPQIGNVNVIIETGGCKA